MSGALSHLRVLDLTRVLAGPWCTQNLGDLGAEIIKIERPGGGDDTRQWGPPWQKDAQGQDSRDSLYYSSANRNKRSVTVDISVPEGQAIVRALAAHCDVFVENYKVGDLQRYQLDYPAIQRINPGIVYCSITGYGQTGPYAQKPGYDFVFQGLSGLMSVTGERDDLPGGGPQKFGMAISDVVTGMYATVAILAALNFRQHSGAGQYIDMSLLDSSVALGGNQAISYLGTGVPPKRYGNAHASVVPYQVFATQDGHMVVAVANDGQWRRMCNAMERPDLAIDTRFCNCEGRIRNRAILIPILEPVFKLQATADWIAKLELEQVPCGPINNYQQVFADPQVQYRGLRRSISNAYGGETPLLASPLNLTSTPVEYVRPPPALGQDTQAVLRDVLGKSDDEIHALADRGVI